MLLSSGEVMNMRDPQYTGEKMSPKRRYCTYGSRIVDDGAPYLNRTGDPGIRKMKVVAVTAFFKAGFSMLYQLS